MNLKDLDINSRTVLQTLATLTSANRQSLAQQCTLKPAQISKALNRLATFELVERNEPKGFWKVSATSYALLNQASSSAPAVPSAVAPEVPSAVAPEPALEMAKPLAEQAEMSTEMSTEMAVDDADDVDFDPTAWVPEPPVTPPPRATSDAIAADLLAAMEIEVALDHVRTKLRSAAIPARAQRVYREVLTVLPPALVEALAPITTLVAAHNLQ